MKILELDSVTVGYDREIDVLHGVSINLEEKESVCLIGANGAGKSTLLNLISGLIHPRMGRIFYNGIAIDHLDPHEIVDLGIIQIPEESETFENLTIDENLFVSCQTKRAKKKREKNLDFIFTTFPILAERKKQLARSLSGGERKMLAIGKAIMQEPKVLLLDDISMGLAPKVVGNLYSRLKTLRKRLEIPILLVEQNVDIALDFANRGYVISAGEIVLTGKAEDLINTEEVKKSYIGA